MMKEVKVLKRIFKIIMKKEKIILKLIMCLFHILYSKVGKKRVR
jgi:hypothetical protein